MKIVIPVAGVGSRLQPHTFTVPKALLHVAGKPVLAHILEPVLQLQPEEVIFVIGFKGEQIKEYITNTYSFPTRFVPQEQLLGLGYALHLALQEVPTGPVLTVLGDTIVECNLKDFIAAGKYVLGLHRVDDPQRFGIAEVNGNTVTKLEEKPAAPRSDLALIGLYYFDEVETLKAELAALVQKGKRTGGEIQLTDALQAMIENGTSFVPYEVSQWYDCGKKETLLQTNRHLLKKISSVPAPEGSLVVPPVFIAPSARITNSIIGPYVSVAEDAVIENSIVTDSVIGVGAQLEHTILDNSLIGRKAIVKGVKQNINIGDYSHVCR